MVGLLSARGGSTCGGHKTRTQSGNDGEQRGESAARLSLGAGEAQDTFQVQTVGGDRGPVRK